MFLQKATDGLVDENFNMNLYFMVSNMGTWSVNRYV